jgi:6-phosphofructokinase 2
MTEIVTITFCPAIDKSTKVEAFIPERKLSCTLPKYEPGGGGVNVARAIKKLGGKATSICFLGGYSGVFYQKLLSDECIKSIIIKTKENTRENLTVLETSTNKQLRFGMPSPKIYRKEWQRCLQIIKELKGVKFLVISGSLPPNLPDSVFNSIVKIVQKKAFKLIVDTSQNHLKEALLAGVYLIKPNLKEFSLLFGKDIMPIEDISFYAKELIKEYKCEIVIVSLGALGAILVTKNEVFNVSSPEIVVKSTVGAGDSMLAGIVLGLANNKSLKEVLTYGVATGTAATINFGTALCRLKDVNNILGLMEIKEMKI